MLNPTLQKRAEKFRDKWGWDNRLKTMGRVSFDIFPDLIAEIRFARENPPIIYTSNDSPSDAGAVFDNGWLAFADHLLSCLGEK